ncbi:hypothetical protein Vi05172_g5699 [Venturia inaequalis]|nr:hypothetical protein Vi05172_g5699 [Venturia inaequalis]
MKLLYLLPVSLLATFVSAAKHLLCCCAGFNACDQFVCDGFSTADIVKQSDNHWAMSTKSWDKNTGSPCGGLKNWMYARGKEYGDDGHLGGYEVSGLCDQYGLSSRCFNPKKEFRKDGLKIKGRQAGGNTNQGGGWNWDWGKKPETPVVGGGKRGSRLGYGEDDTHWPKCSNVHVRALERKDLGQVTPQQVPRDIEGQAGIRRTTSIKSSRVDGEAMRRT